MDIVDKVFPKGVVIFVEQAEGGGVRLRAFDKRPTKRQRIPKDDATVAARQKAGKPVSLTDEQLDTSLLALVTREPGRSRSYYEQLPSSAGGVPGSQHRKEVAVERLLETGQLRAVKLVKPVGRKTHGLYIAFR